MTVHTGAAPFLESLTSGRTLPLENRIATIGFAGECNLQLSGAGREDFVAQIIYEGGAYFLQSLASKLKTTLNGKKVTGSTKLSHGDTLGFGKESFKYFEAGGGKNPSDTINYDPLAALIDCVVSIMRGRYTDIAREMVTSVSRLLKCDAARLVVEEGTARKSIATWPLDAPANRFSNRAIDWASRQSQTVLMHDVDWKDETGSMHSLESNSVVSILCAPLYDGENVIGFLYLDRLAGSEAFSHKEKDRCHKLAPLFSELLQSARQYQLQKQTILQLQNQNVNQGGLIYECESMKTIVGQAAQFAATEAPVLLFGETGTGKEVFARFIHKSSTRKENPFLAINCGAIPKNLIESELFGHEKGAFTGAYKEKKGLFEAARGGTVFLDEIGEMPLEAQVKLLRVLQEGEVTRIGNTQKIPVDTRILAATNRNLEEEVEQGKFRQDLFFRLNVLSLSLPPLRERGQDILLLAQVFIKKYCQQFGVDQKYFSAETKAALMARSWSGNIRELENVIQKAVLLTPDSRIDSLHLSGSREKPVLDLPGAVKSLKEVRSEAEKQAIINALSSTRGNISLSSKLLQIDRAWLTKRIEEYGIEAKKFKG